MTYDIDFIRNTKGFLDEDEGRRLYEIALIAGRMGPCLEIGSYCGKSALYLGAACKENQSVLFSIDHHQGSEEQQPGEEYFDPDLLDPDGGRINTFRHFRKTLETADLNDAVIPIVSRSGLTARFWSTPLALVFIDGGHAFETVLTDYTSWAGAVMNGGYLLIHDIFKNPAEGGQAPYEIYKLALASGLFEEQDMTKTLGVLKRKHA